MVVKHWRLLKIRKLRNVACIVILKKYFAGIDKNKKIVKEIRELKGHPRKYLASTKEGSNGGVGWEHKTHE